MRRLPLSVSIFTVLLFIFSLTGNVLIADPLFTSVAFAKDKDKDNDKGKKKGIRHIVTTLQQQILDLQSQLDSIQLIEGPTGPTGATGAQGPQGPGGNDGSDGANGADGATGPQGDTGSQGPAGNDGADSMVAGPPGSQGDTGPQGDIGFQGPQGDTGPAGPAGTPKVHYVTGHSADDPTDNGFLSGRILTFIKESNTSSLMITYSDNFRAYNPRIGVAQGLWQVYLDGNATTVKATLHSNRNLNSNVAANNIHRHGTLVGFLENIPSGSHTIKIAAVPLSGPPDDLHTGWNGSTFSLVVQELD